MSDLSEEEGNLPYRGASHEANLEAMLAEEGPRGAARRAMHKRLQDLGITSAKTINNLIGNAITPIDFALRVSHEEIDNRDDLLSRLAKLEETSLIAKASNLGHEAPRGKMPGTRFPDGAVAYYQKADQTDMPFEQPAFKTGRMDLSVSNLFHALVADIRIHAVEAVLDHLGISAPTPTGQGSWAGKY